MNEKKPRGYVVAFQERRTAYRALIKDEQAEVVQRLLSAAPAVWHQVKPFRHWAEQIVAVGGFESHIFELKDVKGNFGFTSPRQLNRSLQALRDAWKGVVRVQLCQSSMGETWRLIPPAGDLNRPSRYQSGGVSNRDPAVKLFTPYP